ncbi:MAG: hypothetical protein E4H31_01115 [Dehalococcoidia bacterium]|nr:MAG: hypothetical protein E4H31_01115 [Dehalococcoidia bacterium]
MPHNTSPLKFRLRYIILPLALLVLTIVIAAIFYGQLPSEVHYRFGLDGDPSGNPVSKAALFGSLMAVQIVLLVIAYFTVRTIGSVQLFRDNINNFWFSPTRLLTIMGNMPTIIQLIMGYVLIDAIIYALQGNHLMPLWLFTVIALAGGGIVLIIYALPVVLQAYRGFNSYQEKKKE